MQSFNDEFWVNPQIPTLVMPIETTLRLHASVPIVTFGHLTHTVSGNTLWDVRVGRFVYSRKDDPSTGNWTMQNHYDQVTGVSTGGPAQFGGLTLIRTTAKATLSHYRPRLFGADHQWKVGTQIEKGEDSQPAVIPGGVKFVDDNGQPYQAISASPSISGGQFITAAAFASDAMTIGERLTINAGVRFDHSRAISQDLPAIDAEGRETGEIIRGLGTLYTWNVVSPRLGVAARLTADGRTILRASYGRFNQGVLTGELAPIHSGVTPVTTTAFDAATGGYTQPVSVVDPKINLLIDPRMRTPRTDEYSIGVDRELGPRLAVALAYIHKNGSNFIGWTDVGGQYREETRTLADGQTLPVFVLTNSTKDRRFLLTNPDGYSLTYNGLVMVVEKRRSNGWQGLASYTLSRASGLQASSGATAADAQGSTVAPAFPTATTFGRDPNNLTNADGRLPNDRPHMFRVMGTIDVPRTGLVVGANLQYFSGKPWAATTLIALPQGDQRILLEPRGSRRLSSQAILDLRVSRTIRFGGLGRIELLADVLNVLNDAAEEALATDTLFVTAKGTTSFSPNFGKPTVFMDPRRAMLGARLNLGR
ncbi:MAG TPA: TonB-dependent receptor [Candidatus Acidoferrum sp.]|nr:TonB-dependent receptor [Candidatus Acidoferrum sp.]